MTIRDEFTPKYQGIYDKAMTGRSPKAAIHACCLICTSCKTKEIRNCTNVECYHYLYRPYQPKPHKSHRPTFKKILNRSETGKIVQTGKKSSQRVEKDLIISGAPEGRLRVKLTIEPETE